MPWYAILIWIFLLGGAAFAFIKPKIDAKKYGDVSMEVDKDWYEKSQALYPQDEAYHAYYFCYDKKKINPGHILMDQNRELVYEAKVLFDNPAKSLSEVDFVNHINGLTSHHHISMSGCEWFYIDDEPILEYLENLGFTYKFELDHGLAYTVDLLEKGETVARIYSSNNGKNYFEEKGDIVPRFGSNGLFIIQCQHKYLDAAFLFTVAFTRVDDASEQFDISFKKRK